VKKVSQTQARNTKHAKKAKGTDVSLEAHASTVPSDDVSDSFLLASFSYSPSLIYFFLQALMKKFVALGTECAKYLKVAKASEGATLRHPDTTFLPCFILCYPLDILFLVLQLLWPQPTPELRR
jgi:hypothetical protein